mmetsp:Transcript_6878/g.23452  ORF Transcript_6878/g.23452 Transcript_6878/m.23452 type:complete len:98 (-) Transcript_6878:1596-1889(-)
MRSFIIALVLALCALCSAVRMPARDVYHRDVPLSQFRAIKHRFSTRALPPHHYDAVTELIEEEREASSFDEAMTQAIIDAENAYWEDRAGYDDEPSY